MDYRVPRSNWLPAYVAILVALLAMWVILSVDGTLQPVSAGRTFPTETPTPTLQYHQYLPFVSHWDYYRPTPSPIPTLRPILPPGYWR